MSARGGRAVRACALAGVLALAGAWGAGASEVRFRGLLDLVATGRGEAVAENVLTRGDSPLDPYGMRVFADATVSPRVSAFAQVVLRDASGPYVDGAYAVITPDPARDLHLLAGKLPWAIGTWAPRTYSNENPLLTSPLLYAHHTTLLFYAIPPGADALLAAAGTGNRGVDYFGDAMGVGMPLVDDSYWDVGLTVTGSARPLEFALGVTAGTPGWGSTQMDENAGRTWLGRVGVAPAPWLRAGVSGAQGPYLVAELGDRLPAGRSVEDYRQRLAMADLELLLGHGELRGEAAYAVWETPTIGDLVVRSGYLEARMGIAAGAFLAARGDLMRFGRIRGSDGIARGWDDDLTRVEAGVGYRFTREVVGKLVGHRTTRDPSAGGGARVASLVAAQLSIGF